MLERPGCDLVMVQFLVHLVPAAQLEDRGEAVQTLAKLKHQLLVDHLLSAGAHDLNVFPVGSIANAIQELMGIEL